MTSSGSDDVRLLILCLKTLKFQIRALFECSEHLHMFYSGVSHTVTKNSEGVIFQILSKLANFRAYQSGL